jgi:hypothetical protein
MYRYLTLLDAIFMAVAYPAESKLMIYVTVQHGTCLGTFLMRHEYAELLRQKGIERGISEPLCPDAKQQTKFRGLSPRANYAD